MRPYINDLAQGSSISSALSIELLQSCNKLYDYITFIVNEMFPNSRGLVVVGVVTGFKLIKFTQVRQDPKCATGTPSLREYLADPVVKNVSFFYENVLLSSHHIGCSVRRKCFEDNQVTI